MAYRRQTAVLVLRAALAAVMLCGVCACSVGQETINIEDFVYLLANKTIGIDPGHQQTGNAGLEPIAPGSAVMKPKVSAGTAGVFTHIPEYVITLEMGLKLRDLLESASAHVVMTRDSNAVDISNIERARRGNDANVDIMIRIHADGSANPAARGISILIPSSIYIHDPVVIEKSGNAATVILQSLIAHTRALNRGIVEREDLSGFNWSEAPVILIETGFMTNAEEDRLLTSGAYQDKIVRGIYEGLIRYFIYN
jgi:N-acetylmuramoyl-L-alanine amidase